MHCKAQQALTISKFVKLRVFTPELMTNSKRRKTNRLDNAPIRKKTIYSNISMFSKETHGVVCFQNPDQLEIFAGNCQLVSEALNVL